MYWPPADPKLSNAPSSSGSKYFLKRDRCSLMVNGHASSPIRETSAIPPPCPIDGSSWQEAPPWNFMFKTGVNVAQDQHHETCANRSAVHTHTRTHTHASAHGLRCKCNRFPTHFSALLYPLSLSYFYFTLPCSDIYNNVNTLLISSVETRSISLSNEWTTFLIYSPLWSHPIDIARDSTKNGAI